MNVVTYEPAETIPGGLDEDTCEADGCSSRDDLAFVVTTDGSGVYCSDCANVFMYGNDQ